MAAPPLDEEIVGRLAFPSRTSIPSQEQILADIERVEREMGMASIQSALEPRPAPPTENQQMAEQMWQERWGRTDTPEKIALRLGLGIGSGIGALEKAAGGVLEAPTPPLSLAGVIGRTTPVGAMLRRASRDIGGRLRERGKARAQEYGDIGTEVRSGPLGDIGQALTATAVASAPTIPAAALGGVPAAAVLAGTQSFGQTFSEAKDHYGNEQDALIPAVASGLVTGLATAGFGRTGIESLGAGLTRGTITSLLKEITKQAGYEAAEEGLDQVGQSIIARLSYRPEMRLDEAINETLLATGAGALMGGAVRTGAETAGRAVEGAKNIVEERRFARASRDTARQVATLEADPALSASAVEKRNVFEDTPEQQSLDRLFPVGGETTTTTIPPGEPPAPIAAQPVAPRQPRQRPEVPGTPAEERKTVLQEIREAQAMTIGQIQALFPQAQLTREQARVYRRMAWPEIQEAEPRIEAAPLQESRPPVPAGTAKPKSLPAPLAPVAQTPEVGPHKLPDIQKIASGAGVITVYHGTTQDNADRILASGVSLPSSGEATAQQVARAYGIPWIEFRERITRDAGYGTAVAQLSTAPLDVARLWAKGFPGGEVMANFNSAARLHVASKQTGLKLDQLYDKAEEVAKRLGRQFTYDSAADLLGLPNKFPLQQRGGAVIAFDVDVRNIPKRVRDKAASILKNAPPENVEQFWNSTYQDIKVAPGKLSNPRLVERVEPEYPGPQPPTQLTPAAQTLVPQAPPPQVVPPPVAPATLSVNDFTIQLGREFNSGNPNLDRIQQLADQLPNPEDAVRMSGSWMGLRGQTTGATGIMRGITVRGKPFWQWENEYQQAEDARAKAAPPPDAPQFPLKPLASGWVDARGLPVEMVPDATHASGQRWRVMAAQPQPVEETPKRPPAAAAPPKVSKLRERVATKKEPKGQIAKRIPKKPKPEVPVVETSPMEALMARIEAKEKATAPAVPKTTPVTYHLPERGRLSDLLALPFSGVQAEVAKAILPIVGNVPYRIVDDQSLPAAAFNGSDGILLNAAHIKDKPNFTLRAILHEAVHAASHVAIRDVKNSLKVQRLESLMLLGRQKWAFQSKAGLTAGDVRRFEHALKNVDEFVASVITDGKFQTFLGQIRATSRNSITGETEQFTGSLLRQVWNAIANLLGVRDGTVLSDALTQSESLLTGQIAETPLSVKAVAVPAVDAPVTPAPPPKVVIEKTEADVAPAPDNVMHDAGVRSTTADWSSDKVRRQAALGFGMIRGKWQKVTRDNLSGLQAEVRANNKRRLEFIARMKDYVERFDFKPTDDIPASTFQQQLGTQFDDQTIIEFVQRLETAIRSGNEYVRGLEKQLRRGERGFIAGSKLEQMATDYIAQSTNKANLGVDPVLAVAGIIKGLAILENGIRDFAAWSRVMLDQLGDWVTPHLPTLYARALELEADDKKMSAAKNLLKIKMAGMVTALVPAIERAVAEIKAEILTRNQRGQAPILTGEALDRQRAFDAVAAHPLIRKHFIGPVDRMQEVMTATDGAFTTYREIKADPEATPQMQSAAAHIATKQLDGFYSELRRFQSSYQNKLEKLLEQVEKLNEAKAETAGESEVLNVLLEDFQTFGKEIAYQSRDIGAVRAYRRVLGQSGGVRNTLGFIARFIDIPAKPTREDLLKAIEEHAQPFINDDRAFEQVVGAARETVDMVVDYIVRSEPLRARLKAGKEMLEDKAVSGGRNVLAPFKAALAAAVRAGNVEQAISIYTSGAGKTATERAKTKKLADFFKQKERALLNEMWAMGIVKTYVDQVTTSPTFQDLAKEVYSDLNVRLVNRGTEGIEYVLDPIFDEKPTKLFLKPDGSLLEQNTLALKTYHDNALVYLSDPDAPGYDHRKAAGLQALLDDWAQFTNPFFNPGARKFVESLQTKAYRTIFGQLGRIDLIPQFVIDKAGGMAANLAHRTLNAFSTMQELKIAIMRAHDPKLLRLEMAAMKSHKMKGDVDGYRDKIYAPLEESLQYFENIHQLGVGSPIGNGHVITKEDMVYHEAVRAFEKDAMDTAGGVGKRAFQSIKANPGGILYTIDGQTYIRIPAETGPGTVHRRLGRVGGWVYDWEEARTPDQKRNFINKNADRLLFGYMLGVTNPKYRFTYRFADELRSIVADAKGGNPVASLEDLADRIMDKRVALTEDTEGDGEVVTLADVQSQILAEIDEMFKNYRKYNPTPKEGDKSVAWVFGGADSFNTERGNPIVPPLWYDYGSVSTSERLGYLHNMTAKFAIEHYNAMATLSQVMSRIVDDFETRARTDVDLSSKTNIKRERGEIFYSWGEAKRLAQDVTNYTRLLNEALIFSAKSPDIASGKLDPKSLVAPWMDVGVASALTGPSAMIMNMFGGGRSMALFDRTVRNQSTVGSLLRNGKKFVAGSLREATRLLAHEGNPVGKAIGEFLNNARTKPLIGAAAQTFYDYLMATRELYSRAADEGLHLNVDLWNTLMTEWMWRESGGVATQTPSNVIARKIINPASTALRMFAEVVKQGGVGYVDSRLNVRAVRMEHDLEHDLKKRATLYGDMRLAAAQAQGYDPYDLTDPRNKFSAKELVGGRLPDSAALRLRQLLQSYGDINVDAVMMAFHRQWVEAGRPKDLSTMQMLSEPQRRQLTLAIAADNNLATWATRPLAVRTGRGAAAVGLFQGYPAWYMHKMAQYSERLTGKGWTRGQIESIPTMMAVAVIMTVVGSLGQGLVEEATRRLLNRQSRYPTIFDFNQSAKSYALTLLNGFFNQWAAVGDVGNAMIQRTFRRGFDFNSRMYYLNYVTSVVDTMKEYWQTGRVLRPTLRFLQRWLFPFNYIGPHLPILSGLNEMNQTRNALTSGAHQIGMEARLKAPFSASDVTLTKSTGPLNDFMNAVGNRNMEGLLGAFTELVNVKREEGSADPVGAAIRAIQARNPVTQVFGAKPSPEEFQALFSVMRDDDVRRVKENLQFFDAAVQAIGGSPVSFTKEPGGGGGGGGTGSSGSGGVSSGGIPAARRLPAPPRVSPGVFRSGGLNIGPAATFRLAIPRIRTGIGRLRGRSKVVRVKGGRRGGRLRGRMRSKVRLRV